MVSGRRVGEAGSSTTELVLLIPVVLLAVMVSVQAGLYFHARAVVQAAAQEALEAAQAETGHSDLGRLEAESFLEEAGGIREAAVVVERTLDRVSVEVRAAAPNVLPFAVWSVHASVEGPVERFVPEVER